MSTKKKKIQTPLFFGKEWTTYLEKIELLKKKKLFVARKQRKKKKKIILLNKSLKSKLSRLFFKTWIKNRTVKWTKKQRYLHQLYRQYKNRYSLKKRKDFFKTIFGQILKSTLLNSEIKKGLWWSGANIFAARKIMQIKNKRFYIKKIPWGLIQPHGKEYAALRNSLRRGWLYENLLKRKSDWKAKNFVLDRPHTAFQSHYNQQKKEPWVDALLFQRWAYFGFMEKYKKERKNRTLKMKDYLRQWNPRFHKRNQLYRWRRKLLFDFYKRNAIRTDKAQRIKQVIGKIYLPFYGHLNQRQFDVILKKKKKSQIQIFK